MLNLYDIFEDLLLEAKTKNIRSIIEFAIENNTSIRILYKGEKEKTARWRLIEPYLLGVYKSKTSPIVLRALQLDRVSLTPDGKPNDQYTVLPKGWRVFKLSNIKDVKSGIGKFQPGKRAEYNMNDKGMSQIYMGVLKTTKRAGDLYFRNN
jgi:predicted DNA-binding transcriptional regulator YafY